MNSTPLCIVPALQRVLLRIICLILDLLTHQLGDGKFWLVYSSAGIDNLSFFVVFNMSGTRAQKYLNFIQFSFSVLLLKYIFDGRLYQRFASQEGQTQPDLISSVKTIKFKDLT